MLLYKFSDTFRLGLKSLARHKVRSALTAMGIIFGVCSVIIMLEVNEGASRESQSILRELGSDNIIIRAVKPPTEATARQSGSGVLIYGLTNADVERFKGNLPDLQRCVVSHRTLKMASVEALSQQVTVVATEPAYADVTKVDMLAGRFVSPADMSADAMPCCVITQGLAQRLMPCSDPLTRQISISGELFKVIGVMSRVPRAMEGESADSDNCVLVPLTSQRQRFGDFTIIWGQGSSTYEKTEVNSVILRMQDERSVADGAAIARNLLKRYHAKLDYEVKVPVELIEQLKRQKQLWNVMFVSIASVSLVVGGIGIMNIMLATVTERTREIGIRRALGAKRGDIIVQFLVEAVILTMVGGLVGIGIGLGAPPMLAWTLNYLGVTQSIAMVWTSFTILMPFVMAIVVGLASGLYPALRAARLDPIVALRHE